MLKLCPGVPAGISSDNKWQFQPLPVLIFKNLPFTEVINNILWVLQKVFTKIGAQTWTNMFPIGKFSRCFHRYFRILRYYENVSLLGIWGTVLLKLWIKCTFKKKRYPRLVFVETCRAFFCPGLVQLWWAICSDNAIYLIPIISTLTITINENIATGTKKLGKEQCDIFYSAIQ